MNNTIQHTIKYVKTAKHTNIKREMEANKMNMRTMRERSRARGERSFYMVCCIDFSPNLFPTKNRAFFCVVSFLCSMHHKTHTCILISCCSCLFSSSLRPTQRPNLFVCIVFCNGALDFFSIRFLATIVQVHTVHCVPFHLSSDDDRIQAHFSASSLNIMNKYTLCFVFIRCCRRRCFFFCIRCLRSEQRVPTFQR